VALYQLSYARMIDDAGAGERTRTVDSHLGKVALYQLSYARIICRISKSGAGERTRTVDSHLGKVALYQLSYARTSENQKLLYINS
jgi:hypothetical protein